MTTLATPRAGRRARFAIAALALLTVGLLALPAGASASNATCRGHINAGKADDVNDNPVDYTFACSDAITAYTIVSDVAVQGFEPEVQVFDKAGSILNSDSFNCEGDVPGLGVSCKGVYGADQRVVKGNYDLSRAVCAAGRTHPLLVITDAKGSMAGPVDLGRPHGCPKAARADRHHRGKSVARRGH
jgi:hypothetical protein